jgi:hypothetical protein
VERFDLVFIEFLDAESTQCGLQCLRDCLSEFRTAAALCGNIVVGHHLVFKPP